MNVRGFSIFYFFIFQYFFYDVCACNGRSCRPETTEIVIKIQGLGNKKNDISSIIIKKRKNPDGLHFLKHNVVGDNFEKMYFVVSDEYNLKGLLLFELKNTDLDGNESTNYLVYSADNYISQRNVEGDDEKIQFNAINFFVPSGKNDGKYVLGTGDDVEVMFSSLKNNNANKNLIFNDSIEVYRACEKGKGIKDKEENKKVKKVDITTVLDKDSEKPITLIIKKQLLESSSTK